MPSGSLPSGWFPTSSACWPPSLSTATLARNRAGGRSISLFRERKESSGLSFVIIRAQLDESHVTLPGSRLTKVVDLDRGHFADVPLDEKIDVGQNDERGRQRWPGVVLHDQVVALELPVDVAVGLHLREGMAAGRRREAQAAHVSVRVLDATP